MRRLPPDLISGGSWFLPTVSCRIRGSWVQADPKLAERLLKLVVRDPFHGLGKPEPLKRLPNTWSRRLTDEHRLTYRVTDEHVDFLQARFHYFE